MDAGRVLADEQRPRRSGGSSGPGRSAASTSRSRGVRPNGSAASAASAAADSGVDGASSGLARLDPRPGGQCFDRRAQRRRAQAAPPCACAPASASDAAARSPVVHRGLGQALARVRHQVQSTAGGQRSVAVGPSPGRRRPIEPGELGRRSWPRAPASRRERDPAAARGRSPAAVARRGEHLLAGLRPPRGARSRARRVRATSAVSAAARAPEPDEPDVVPAPIAVAHAGHRRRRTVIERQRRVALPERAIPSRAIHNGAVELAPRPWWPPAGRAQLVEASAASARRRARRAAACHASGYRRM